MEKSAVEKVTPEETFLFDLQGFLLLKNVLSPEECREILAALRRAESRSYDDSAWMKAALGEKKPMATRHVSEGSVRLNGLMRLDPVFDTLMDHPRVLPRLKEFMGSPQLINTWSISKEKGTPGGNWHRGLPPTDYTFRNNTGSGGYYASGSIRTGMLNVVWFLTDNGPEDGCVTAIPGSHKNNIDLPWNDYKDLGMPGSIAVTGKAGDVFMFSESVIHNGLPKSTGGTRSNLYYNYMRRGFHPGEVEPHNLQHFFMPADVRARFTPQRRELTRWMEHTRWEY
jgi:ectoine hydroxylase-related dioxygenase (phytanoyl-CoA dioxygenase family)